MNLEQIRDQIYRASDSEPDTIKYKKYIDSQINFAIEQIHNSRPWLFSIKESDLDIFKDIDQDSGSSAITVDLNPLSRTITFSNAIRDLGYGFYHESWIGQQIEIEGRNYTILKINSATEMVLAEAYQDDDSTGNTETITNWKLKHPIYRLPEDCAQLLSFSQTEEKVPGISTYQTQLVPVPFNQRPGFDWDKSETEASLVFTQPTLNIPPGQKLTMSIVNSATNTAIPLGKYVQLAWAFYHAGRYGPLSEPTDITELTAGVGELGSYATLNITFKDYRNNNIAITNPAGYKIYSQHPFEGYSKVLFHNININQSTGEELGNPCWVMVRDYTDTTDADWLPIITLDDDATTSITYNRCLDSDGPRFVEGVVKQIRPYPRINSSDLNFPYQNLTGTYDAPKRNFKQVKLQYISKPKKLYMNQDVPEMPDEFHYLIIYKALENVLLYQQKSLEAQTYSLKYNKEIKSLEGRYLNTKIKSLSRRSWTQNGNILISYDGRTLRNL